MVEHAISSAPFHRRLTGIVQINTVVIVAIDRYICITRPMSPFKLNQAKAKMCVGIAWGIAFLIAFFPFLGWSSYVPEGM